MEKIQDCQSDGFKAKRVSLKLQGRQSRQEHNTGVRLYFDKRLQKCITKNINDQETPFRYSLSQQNGLAATRGKAFMEPTFSARKRLREKEIEKEKQQENVPELSCKPPNSLLVLPKISQGSRPLVTIPASSKENKDSKLGHFEGIPDFRRPRNAREYWENKTRVLQSQKSDFIESQRSYEDIMRLREKHLLACNLVKTTTPRSQLSLPHLRLKTATQNLKYFEYRKADEDTYEETSSSSEDDEDKVVLSDFSRTLNDGSRIIASNHKLSIEVFMPKI